MRNIVLSISFLLFLLLAATTTWGQCDPVLFPQDQMDIYLVSSESPAHPASALKDGNPNTWFSPLSSLNYPHEIYIDLGVSQAITAISLTGVQGRQAYMPMDFELYFSEEPDGFDMIEVKNHFLFDSLQDVGPKPVKFGAVQGRYLLLVLLNSAASWNKQSLEIAEINVFTDPCGAAGKKNQQITFQVPEKRHTAQGAYPLIATSSTNLPLQFDVLDGPASINGNLLEPTGEEGWITIRAFQNGNASFYPGEIIRRMYMVKSSDYFPQLKIRLTDKVPLEMAALEPYQIVASASILYPEFFAVNSIEVLIGGVPHDIALKNGFGQLWWKPNNYGKHELIFSCVGTNGNKTEQTIIVDVTTPSEDRTTSVFNKELVAFGIPGAGTVIEKEVVFPQSHRAFNHVKASFAVTCPSIPEGCDDWDRLASVEVKNEYGEWVEIIRYITPYGVACTHEIEVTEYLSLLQGAVQVRIEIGTFGSGGWDVHLNLTFTEGTPAYAYSKVFTPWNGTYPFGDFINLRPVPIAQVNLPDGIEKATLQLVTTGHGWGPNNSGNAAEFFEATHQIQIDGVPTFTQHNWTICDPNPDQCAPQFGTYKFNRAGWCPGAISRPDKYDLGEFISKGTFSLRYLFHPGYVDLCHPNAPGCINNVTCQDCNDGFNPHFRVSANIIFYSNAVITNAPTLVAQEQWQFAPNPVKEQLLIQSAESIEPYQVMIFDNSGKLWESYTVPIGKGVFQINTVGWPSAMYMVRCNNSKAAVTQKILVIH